VATQLLASRVVLSSIELVSDVIVEELLSTVKILRVIKFL
jgi:hypothetical protein